MAHVVCLSWELIYQGSLLEYEICSQKQLVGIMALLLLSCEAAGQTELSDSSFFICEMEIIVPTFQDLYEDSTQSLCT